MSHRLHRVRELELDVNIIHLKHGFHPILPNHRLKPWGLGLNSNHWMDQTSHP